MLNYKSKEVIKNLKSIIQEERMAFNEQTTKHFLILPLVAALGYDINDHRVLMHEYTPTQLKGSLDKVDYVLRLPEFMIFIEAKALKTNLTRYYHQLQKYFNSSPDVKLGIITDGRYYHFFTDFYHQNLMDMDPFYKIDLCNLNEFDYRFLSLISQGTISSSSLEEITEEIIFQENVLTSFKKVVEDLPPDFVKLVLKDFYPHPATKKVLDRTSSIILQAKVNSIDLSGVNTNFSLSPEAEVSPRNSSNLRAAVSTETNPIKEPALKPLSLKKGEQKRVEKQGKGLDRIKVGLGWDISSDKNEVFDLDLAVFLLNSKEKVPNSNYFVFYNNPDSYDKSVHHTGDNRTGAGEGDDESVHVQLSKVSSEVQKIAFIANIHEGRVKGQSFRSVQNAFIRIVDLDTDEELMRFDLSQEFSKETMLLFGVLIRGVNGWEFNAVGDGYEYELLDLCRHFGVQVG